MIIFRVRFRSQLGDHLAIYGDAACNDQFFRAPARSNTGGCDQFLQTLLHNLMSIRFSLSNSHRGGLQRTTTKLKHIRHYDPPLRSWKSSTLGSSVKSFKPNCSKNSLDVPYIMGRPTVSFRPLATISFLSRRVLMADGDCTPRISRISGTVTG